MCWTAVKIKERRRVFIKKNQLPGLKITHLKIFYLLCSSEALNLNQIKFKNLSSEKDTDQSNLKDEVLKLFIWTFHQRIIEDYFRNVMDKEEGQKIPICINMNVNRALTCLGSLSKFWNVFKEIYIYKMSHVCVFNVHNLIFCKSYYFQEN